MANCTVSNFFISGAQAGTMIALPVSGILANDVGWESVFYFFGALGVAWFLFWIAFCYDSPAVHPRIDKVNRPPLYYKL